MSRKYSFGCAAYSTFPISLMASAIIVSMFSPVALAIPLDNQELTITAADPVDSYQLINNSTLNVNGATTSSISVVDSTLNISSGVTQVSSGPAVRLVDSGATISNADVRSTSGVGLLLAHAAGSGSTAVVSSSVIVGGSVGAQVNAGGVLQLSGSQVSSTNGVGLNLIGGTANVVGSTITGQNAGVVMMRENAARPDGAALTLDGSSVTGLVGPAIDVTGNATAVINVLNGSTLVGGNGTMLSVRSSSTAQMNVADSALRGNIDVANTGSATVELSRSSMVGDVINAAGGVANLTLKENSNLTGRLENVSSAEIDGTSSWDMTGTSSVGDLAVNGGQVRMGDTGSFYQLNVTNLSGNGSFYMGTDFVSGQTDFINVTGTSSGNHGVLAASSSQDATQNQIRLAHFADNGATLHLLNTGGRVDVGAYSYGLVHQGTDWYLVNTFQESSATQTVKALFNAPITVAYGEIASLRTRLGELRYGVRKSSGPWTRAYGSKYNIAQGAGVGYQQTQHGFSVGIDTWIEDSNWLVGVLAGHSRSDLNLVHGSSGTVDSYYFGGYATWMDPQSGWYVDNVLKFNSYDSEAKASLSDGARAKGDYTSHGVSASVEAGRHIKLDDDYFLEPFGQFAVTTIKGKDFSLDNGMRAQGDTAYSVLGKVGSSLGKTIDLGKGRMVQPYVKAALVQEFAPDNKVQVNSNTFNNDMSGTRGEFSVGTTAKLSKAFSAYGELGYSNGKNIEQPYGFNAGVRYEF